MKHLLFALAASFALLITPAARADEATHKKAAEDFFQAAEMEAIFVKATDQALETQIQQAPDLAPMKEIMKTFFNKYMSWAALKEDLTKLYMQTFTEPELVEITKFYQTPTGKKMAQTSPDLMNKSSALGTQKVQEHIGELQTMIQEEMKKKGGK